MLEYNENGVLGNYRGSYFVPLCCSHCAHYDWDSDDVGYNWYWYCMKNVWPPTRKGTCDKFYGDEQYNTNANVDKQLRTK